MSGRRRASSRAEWTAGNAQTAMFDTGAADQGALFAWDHLLECELTIPAPARWVVVECDGRGPVRAWDGTRWAPARGSEWARVGARLTRADALELAGDPEPRTGRRDRFIMEADDRPNDHRACVTCGSTTAGGDRCPRCVELGATALELIDETE